MSYFTRHPVFGRGLRPVLAVVLLLGLQAVSCSTSNPTATSTKGRSAALTAGKWRIEYDLTRGVADVYRDEKLLIPETYAEARLPEVITSRDYRFHKVSHQPIHDGFGTGEKYVVESFNGEAEMMRQTFWLYADADYFLTDVEVDRKAGATSNYLSPLTTETGFAFGQTGEDRALFVPFDNDMWIRYNAVPFGGTVTSHEVTALYDTQTRQGLVIGSIEHNVWKTGVTSVTSSNAIHGLAAFGGFTSTNSHDVLPHGKISGESIRSPKIFVGAFSDWRRGLESYAHANATVAPRRPWRHGVPFGWNSWGKLQFKLTYEKAMQVSDFFAQELQPAHFENDGVVYIGLDSGWDRFSDAELKSFVDHCHSNHQEAGIYFTPFTAWTHDVNQQASGTPYKYGDLFLYANGRPQTIDGGTALDPTHPGTQAMIRARIEQFRRAGFKYIKADFMTHGALEADHYHDPQVTTGMQAYNEGMRYIDQLLGEDIYLNLSISPLFPAQYANSRRIACDTFGRIGETEYMLNALTYGWWLDGVYDFNDADHIVLEGHSEGENRARVTSSAICGIFISGDDFSAGGSAEAKARARQFLTNADIDAVAGTPKSFRPVDGAVGDHAANCFVYQDRDYLYVAVFNFGDTNVSSTIAFSRLGLNPARSFPAKELWSGGTEKISNPMRVQLAPADAALYRISKRSPGL